MATVDYNSTHTGGQIDDAIDKARNPDTTPTASSAALITSGAVAAAIAAEATRADAAVAAEAARAQAAEATKQNVLTFDNVPTNGSNNPVKSDGIYDALALKAPLASPALTGNPTAPTQTAGNNSTRIATTAFVTAAVAAEQTRAEAAEALKAPLDSPALTGTPTAPTPSDGDSSTKIATTQFVNRFLQPPMRNWFGTCDTPDGTLTKSVTISDYTGSGFSRWMKISVLFTYAQTAQDSSVYLSINEGTGRLVSPCVFSGNPGEPIDVPVSWSGGTVVDFVWNGSGWIMMDTAQATADCYGKTMMTDAVPTAEPSSGSGYKAASNRCVYKLNNKIATPQWVGARATQAFSKHDYFTSNDGFIYKATADIAQGDIVTPGTNCEATTICGELSADVPFTIASMSPLASADGNVTRIGRMVFVNLAATMGSTASTDNQGLLKLDCDSPLVNTMRVLIASKVGSENVLYVGKFIGTSDGKCMIYTTEIIPANRTLFISGFFAT